MPIVLVGLSLWAWAAITGGVAALGGAAYGGQKLMVRSRKRAFVARVRAEYADGGVDALELLARETGFAADARSGKLVARAWARELDAEAAATAAAAADAPARRPRRAAAH